MADLPDDYRTVAGIYRRALGERTFTGWMIWPVSETVTTLALQAPAPDAFADGLLLLSELTPRLTSEFAIRRFLAADLDRALTIVLGWTTHPDPAVRRLASEGTRSFLPWAIRVRPLLEHPASTVPIIDALYRDDDEVVRRSVANHLNDLSRQSPDLVVQVATRWLAAPAPTTTQLVRHGLRTLIKKGQPDALALLGFGQPTIARRCSRARPRNGDGSRRARLRVHRHQPRLGAGHPGDRLHRRLPEKQRRAPGEGVQAGDENSGPGETVRLSKKHAFRPMTTRVHYTGLHHLELQINGQRYPGASFDLVV